MAEPTKKNPEIERLIDATNPSGRKRVDSIKQDICAWCGGPATDFRGELSKREYTISGFCQRCQDGVFGVVGTITLGRPIRGYCVMKCLRELNNEEYAHLPDFCNVEEHGKDNPVTLCNSTGREIRQLDWDTYRRVYVMD